MTELTLILPINNEATHLNRFLDQLKQVVDSLEEEVLVLAVDDGSSDDSWEKIKHRAREWKQFEGLKLSRKFGKEHALAAGIEAAQTDAVLTMDADGQHPVAMVPDIIKRWKETNSDLVEAVKADWGDESVLQKVRKGSFYTLLKWTSGSDFRGATDFKLLGPKAKAAWCELGERNLFFRGMVDWLGMTREQMPFDVENRRAGESSFGFWTLCRLSTTAITSFSSAPLTIITALGTVMLVLSLVMGAWTLLDWFFGAKEGFTTVILLQLFVSSLILVSLGVIGEYIARIYDEVKMRPRYLVSEKTY
jgi:glycosyltransferase involved in cell wall biosynthesis